MSDEDQERFAQDPSSQMDIYLMRVIPADGLGLRRLTTALGYDGGPFFSADGKRIVWRRFSPDGTRAEGPVLPVPSLPMPMLNSRKPWQFLVKN